MTRWSVRAVTTPALAAGFRLVGVATDAVRDADEAGTRVALLAADPGVGVVLIDASLLDAMPEAVRREVQRRPVPIIVPVPSPVLGEPPADAETMILDLLRRAIGYRVQLR